MIQVTEPVCHVSTCERQACQDTGACQRAVESQEKRNAWACVPPPEEPTEAPQ